jgi:hypothetical protein
MHRYTINAHSGDCSPSYSFRPDVYAACSHYFGDEQYAGANDLLLGATSSYKSNVGLLS